MAGKATDEFGNRYGRLTVIARADNHGRHASWDCLCECGNSTTVQGRHLRNGETQSCGCLWKENAREATILRGLLTENPKYDTMHKRVARERGRAAKYTCVDCGLQAAEWSYDGLDANERRERVGRYFLAYSEHTAHYTPRCRPCHVRYDRGAA